MKLIINNNGIVCYTQIKDIAYLTEYTGNENYLKKYIDLVNQGFDTDTFIRVNDNNIIEDLINCHDIIDFMEFKHTDALTISRTIGIAYKTDLFSSYSNTKRISELRTLIEFKSTNEGLSLPPVADGEYYNSNGIYELYSIPLEGYYVLNGPDISDGNYKEYLDQCIMEMDGEYSYTDTIIDNKVFVKVNKIKKKNIFSLGKKNKNS